MFYQIGEQLISCTAGEALGGEKKYAAVLTPEEWNDQQDRFGMGMDLPLQVTGIEETSIQVNYDSLTGTFCLPDVTGDGAVCLAFAMDERGIVFIDGTGTAETMLGRIAASKKWRRPGLERFIYDFLEELIIRDNRRLDGYEKRLNAIENEICSQEAGRDVIMRINDIRGELIDLNSHYEQLIDIGQELEENENGFFAEDNLRFFHLFTVRAERLKQNVASLRDYSIQLRDLQQSQLEVKQNRNMAVLTIITSVFVPLSLLTGWFGMNFRWMPELEQPWAYPALIVLCIVIVIAEIVWMKKKKMW